MTSLAGVGPGGACHDRVLETCCGCSTARFVDYAEEQTFALVTDAAEPVLTATHASHSNTLQHRSKRII